MVESCPTRREYAMPERVSFDEVNELIRVKSVGDVPTSVWKESLEKVIGLKEKHNTNRLLVDTKEQLTTSDYSDIFEYAKTIPKDIKLALLVEDISGGKAHSTEPKQRFLEAIGIQQELEIKSFVDEDEALSWLKN